MSEKIKLKVEADKTPAAGAEHHERASRHHESRAESAKHEHRENIDHILKRIEKTAVSGRETNEKSRIENTSANQASNHRFVGEQLKDNSLKRSLRRIQKDLKPYQRPFSKFLHNGVVERVSEVSATTIARPDGLLFGGVVCLLTSIGVLLICRYYGYEYNYFIGLISFPAGFFIGLFGEFIIRPLKRRG